MHPSNREPLEQNGSMFEHIMQVSRSEHSPTQGRSPAARARASGWPWPCTPRRAGLRERLDERSSPGAQGPASLHPRAPRRPSSLRALTNGRKTDHGAPDGGREPLLTFARSTREMIERGSRRDARANKVKSSFALKSVVDAGRGRPGAQPADLSATATVAARSMLGLKAWYTHQESHTIRPTYPPTSFSTRTRPSSHLSRHTRHELVLPPGGSEVPEAVHNQALADKRLDHEHCTIRAVRGRVHLRDAEAVSEVLERAARLRVPGGPRA